VVDYRAIAYDRYASAPEINYAKFVNAYGRRISPRVAISRNWHCLDLACGFGNFLAYLRSLGVSEFMGVDSSRECARRAEAEFGQAHVVCEDIFCFLAKANRSFDLISAVDLIEHLKKEEVFQFLALVKKVQKPGGFLLLRTPNAAGLFGMAARYNDITHEICFTPVSISDVLGRCGYRVVQIWEDGPAPGTVLQSAHWLAWRLVKFLIRLANAAETGGWGDGILARNMWVLAEGEAGKA
jgi:SAM-dependent methyltransferase